MHTRRSTEMLLLAAATPAVLLMFALLHAAETETLEWPVLMVPAGLIGAFAIAHLVVRFRAPASDPVLLPIVALLSGVGLAFVTRLDPELAASQLRWLLVGVAAFVLTLIAMPPLERLARYKYTIMLAGLALLISPSLVGVEINGARLWLRFAGMSFQPAEVAKILLVLFFAAYLSENREVLSVSTRRFLGVWMPPARQLGPLLAMWAVSLFVLIVQKDLGSSLLFFGMLLVAFYVATGRIYYVLAGGGLFAAGATVAYSIFPHIQTRIAIWLDPFADVSGRGYQLAQSLFALASGSITGVGIGNGFPERIPFVETDFIFAAIAEELGLLGGVALILAYFTFCMRGLSTAARARSDMAAFTAAGLTGAFALQTFVIIGGVTRLIPLTGVTLPFVSYGGSSVLANFILLALLLHAGNTATGQDTEVQLTDSAGVLGRVALTRRLTRTASVIALLILILVVNLTWVQVIRAETLLAHPANTRALAAEQRSPRGAILSADLVVLAESVPAEDGRYVRRYPQDTLAAHTLGYYSVTYGRAGIEAAANAMLTGRRSFRSFRDAVEAAAGLPVPGNDIGLTIHSEVQRAAEQALVGHRGAIVALDPRTGAVLALAASPTYNPNAIDAQWEEHLSSDSAPLLNRATQSLYPPGSTFKVVTLTAAFGAGLATSETTYSAPGRLEIGGAPVSNFGGTSYGTVSLRRATSSSINTVFGQLAVDIGPKDLVAQAVRFGFNDMPPLEIPARASLMPKPSEMTDWETAWAGIGQPVGEHESPPGPQATVLQMALVAAGIANDGVVMQPHLITRVTDPAGRILSTTPVRIWTRACDKKTADLVTELMVEAVSHGSGRAASIPGVQIAGKTGTAETGKDGKTHAWFIAFAPAENPTVAVAVVLENAGIGGRLAAPAAKGVLKAALAR